VRDLLAERLLATVMGWTQEDVAQERPDLQAMAAYKYDEYQQFSPGMRFVESLALWLSQFKTAHERIVAYEFVKKRLIFCSTAELNHLVRIAYPDHIRPLLLRKVATEAGYNARHVAKVAESVKFKIRQRQCLFLGLSDGAHIDVFRRSNSPELSHEQMLQTYEISSERVESLLKKLADDMANLLGGAVPDHMQKFRTVILLDDLSASGKSYVDREQDGTFGGKIGRFYRNVTDLRNEVSRLVDLRHTEIFVVLCLATAQARDRLESLLKEMWEPLGTEYDVIVVHPLKGEHCLKPGGGSDFETLLNAYYDPTIEDEHTQKGGTDDLKYGFAGCGLPLVLSHNTPNNSLYLLWAGSKKVRALFPRVSRHIGSVGIGEKYEGTA
jgi:hypothetical protein